MPDGELDAVLARYGAHSLRSGFLTESGRRGIAQVDAMALSRHRSLAVAHGYYEAAFALRNPAARLRQTAPPLSWSIPPSGQR